MTAIDATSRQTSRIRELNDMLRTSFIGGHVVLTCGVRGRGQAFESACVEAVQRFSEFSADNDPYGEHDFGAVTIQDTKVFWKIDYYDRSLSCGSENPADPVQTARVLTIMLASEY